MFAQPSEPVIRYSDATAIKIIDELGGTSFQFLDMTMAAIA
jgi:hypothetical protein